MFECVPEPKAFVPVRVCPKSSQCCSGSAGPDVECFSASHLTIPQCQMLARENSLACCSQVYLECHSEMSVEIVP